MCARVWLNHADDCPVATHDFTIGSFCPMRARIRTLTALIPALGSSVVAAQAPPALLRNAPAATAIGRLLAGREQLALSAGQVARPTALENQLKHAPGCAVGRGLGRVRAKAVPRLDRVGTTATEAFRRPPRSSLLNSKPMSPGCPTPAAITRSSATGTTVGLAFVPSPDC